MDCVKATASAALYPWRKFWCLYQIYLDKTVLHVRRRWLVTATLASIFALRIFYHPGFYAVAVFLSLYIVNLISKFMTPPPRMEHGVPLLPIKGSDELRPFIGKLSEFGLWYATTKGYIVSIAMTFYSIFVLDLIYFPVMLLVSLAFMLGIVLAIIFHLWGLRYLPFTIGKQGIRW